MKLYGVTEAQLREIVSKVSREQYAGNLGFNNLTRHNTFVQFTLRVNSSRGKGARLSWTGRHITAACWHAHRDVMKEIFRQFPEARLITAQARYIGADGFEKAYPETGYKNIGSQIQPLWYQNACDCAV